jgi:hypothetical protein
MTSLYKLTAQLRELEALADEGEVPAAVLADTVEGLTGEIEAKAQHIGQFIGNLEASTSAIDDAIAEMKSRRDRIQRHADWLRGYLFTQMQAAGITKITCPWFTLAIRKNPPKVVITDPGAIPGELYVYPVAPPPYPDKNAISAKLKAGEVVDGAHLEQGERLDIRT